MRRHRKIGALTDRGRRRVDDSGVLSLSLSSKFARPHGGHGTFPYFPNILTAGFGNLNRACRPSSRHARRAREIRNRLEYFTSVFVRVQPRYHACCSPFDYLDDERPVKKRFPLKLAVSLVNTGCICIAERVRVTLGNPREPSLQIRKKEEEKERASSIG